MNYWIGNETLFMRASNKVNVQYLCHPIVNIYSNYDHTSKSIMLNFETFLSPVEILIPLFDIRNQSPHPPLS